ncbi:MAG TPA: TIGR01777 family oxidoreductase [Gemmatimonadaceae bacterium]|nr:TIGR01777 family oxidoreductase [Gemmatimonadaceae bacterium]
MVIAVSGSSGLIGSALAGALEARGHTIKRLVRRPARRSDEISWDPAREQLDARALEGVDAVINLAGENLARRWTAGARDRIRSSRVNGTTMLARALAAMPTKPRVMLSASAVGIYGNRGDEILDESSTLGSDFLASVCKDWEGATAPAADAGIRVVHLRTGVVLSRREGVLAKLLLPFRLGLGGRLGDGRQWMSWIALTDLVAALAFLLRAEAVSGAVNLVAPNPVMNAEFARTLAHVLGRPAVFPVPRFALTLLFGQMAEDTILSSQRVRAGRLLDNGFKFKLPTLDEALYDAGVGHRIAADAR